MISSRRNNYGIIILLIVFIIIGQVYAEENLSSDFDVFIKGTEFGDLILSSGKGNLTYEWIHVDSTNIENLVMNKNWKEGKLYPLYKNYKKVDITFVFKGKKERSEVRYIRYMLDSATNKKIVHMNLIRAFNGEKTDALYLHQEENKIIKPQGEIFAGNVIPKVHNPLYYFNTVIGAPISSFLQGNFFNSKINNLQLIGEDMIDGLICKVFSGIVANSDSTITVWLAPKYMYRPPKIKIECNDGEMVQHNYFIQNHKGYWYSNQTIVENYYFKENTNEKILNSREIITMHDDFEFNIELSNDLFEINYPRGIGIFDRRTYEKILIK